MSINGPEELAGMRAAGAIVRRMLEAMKQAVRPGITTAELDAVGATVMREQGAQSAPQLVYKFPGVNCISLNDEAVHGIPGERAVEAGDLVKLDVTIEKDGYMADAAETVAVGEVSEEKPAPDRLCRAGLYQSHAGGARRVPRVRDRPRGRAGSAPQRLLGDSRPRWTRHRTHHPRRASCTQLRRSRSQPDSHEGLVITVEPIIAAGSGRAFVANDGWTVRTADRRPSAHFEHTLVITQGEPILLTAG